MPAEKVTLTANLSSSIAEVLDADVLPAAISEFDRTVTHSAATGFNATILPTDTPHPVSTVVLEITLEVSGEYLLDLRAAPTTSTPDAGEDLNGQQLMYLEVVTPAANEAAVLIGPGDTNGYECFGEEVTLDFPKYTNAVFLFRGEELPEIDATHKVLKIAGEEGDVVLLKMCFATAPA